MSEDKKVIFSMSGISKSFPGSNQQVLKDIYLSFFYGAKIGILGLNGSGKSTLLNIIAGRDKTFNGDLVFSEGYSVGLLEQEPEMDESKTVIEIVKEGVASVISILNDYNSINDQFSLPEVYEDSDKMEELMKKQSKLQDKIDYLNAWDIDNQLEIAMDALRTPHADEKVNVLSGGERRRVALCRLLLKKPDVLLLDEPTNHLDAESVKWLEQHLSEYKGTVIAVTHDRYFLDNVAGWILELDRGQGIPWKGNYSSWLDQKSKRLSIEQKQASKRQKTLERELEWIRMTPKGRQAKQKARLSNYEVLANQDQSKIQDKLEIFIPSGPRLGNEVFRAEKVSKSFENKILFENLTFSLPKSGIVGVIGPNGAGKSTLFKMIMGEESLNSGKFIIGETVKLAYVDQKHSNLDLDKSIWSNFSNEQELIMMGGKQINSRAFLSRFNFSGSEQNKKVSKLSGGERNRLYLAMTLKVEGNLLLLDEPTNDLDINTLRALEEGLENFSGCAVVISHDRWFLDRICTHILAFEGESNVYFFSGSYSEYEENKKKRFGDEIKPKRIKYKKLIRD
ncbi:MAG: energy-dependent translational throttle protein EttA [Flavobacteriaceae bacterium]|nr:energy-dependent translational throttle protein EttA [Flavobacteriaceae bacterium]